MSLEQKILDKLTLAYPSSVPYSKLSADLDESDSIIQAAACNLYNQKYPVHLQDQSLSLAYPLLSAAVLENLSPSRLVGSKLTVFSSLTSTNSYAKENLAHLKDGEVIFAHEQTAGKGRLGRNWTSPFGKSLSMSIVLKPSIALEHIPLLTQLTAAALVKALKDWGETEIKWPNDIVLNKKKIAGILIETEFSGSSLDGIIIGVGLNTNLDQGDIPPELQNKATSIKSATKKVMNPNSFLDKFFYLFDYYYTEFLESKRPDPFLSVCRSHSALIGESFWVIKNAAKRKAFIQDIDCAGGLVVRFHDTNQTEHLTSSDLSIRGKGEYL